MKIFKQILLTILGISLFMVSALVGYSVYNIQHVTTHISKDNADLGIEDETIKELQELMSLSKFNKDEIVNIALFGIDTRSVNNSKNSRSDSIIIATIDKKHNKIKLSSIMRDTYVKIDGHNNDKINHAYAFGGPQLAIKTINQNFGLDIKDFITVDFFGLEKIIDAIGGVQVDVKEHEVRELNKFIKEVAKIENKPATLIERAGTQTLNGMQAVSFGRIRKVGNGDYERTDRQRQIIIAMLNKIKTLDMSKVLSLINECSSSVRTSMTLSEGAKLATDVLSNMKNFTISQERFPKTGEGKKINGIWYMTTDIEKTKNSIQDFIYEVDRTQD